MATPDHACNDYVDQPREACVLIPLMSPADAAAADTTSPIVANISPADLSEIAPDQIVAVDVTDTGEIRRTIITVRDGRETFVIFNGTSFLYPFATSSRAPITDGWRYSLRRAGGWRSKNPQFSLVAIDTGGNEAE
jgi:hypothetical protein